MGSSCNSGCVNRIETEPSINEPLPMATIPCHSYSKMVQKVRCEKTISLGKIVQNFTSNSRSVVQNRTDRYKNSNSTNDPQAAKSLANQEQTFKPYKYQVQQNSDVQMQPIEEDELERKKSKSAEQHPQANEQPVSDLSDSLSSKSKIKMVQLGRPQPDTLQPSFNGMKRISQPHLQLPATLQQDQLRRRFSCLGLQQQQKGHSFEHLVLCFTPAEKSIAPSPGRLIDCKRTRMMDGSYYEGQMIQSQAHGFGTYTFPDGSCYSGEVCLLIVIYSSGLQWVYGKAYGMGSFTHTNGDRFEGQWANNSTVGVGTYTYASKVVYQGAWRNDCPNGFGKEVYPDGSYYEGLFLNGQKHGDGIMTFANGEMYQGQFSHDHMHGIGNYAWPNQKHYQGSWRQSKMDGKGILTMPDGNQSQAQVGSQYIGEYREDKKHGFGTFTMSDGSRYAGLWANGLQHGEGEFTSKEGNVKRGVWINGKYTQVPQPQQQQQRRPKGSN